MRVSTAFDGENVACENWREHEQQTPPHTPSSIQGHKVALAAVRGDKTLAGFAQPG